MRKEYEKFYQLYEGELYDEALFEFMKVEKETPPTATELVHKGRAIYRSSDETPFELEDVEKTYKKAIELDENCFAAYISLGYFYLNVMDDAQTAKPYFEGVFDMLHALLEDAVIGDARCISELENVKAGLAYLERNSVYPFREEVLKEAKYDIELLGND